MSGSFQIEREMTIKTGTKKEETIPEMLDGSNVKSPVMSD